MITHHALIVTAGEHQNNEWSIYTLDKNVLIHIE